MTNTHSHCVITKTVNVALTITSVTKSETSTEDVDYLQCLHNFSLFQADLNPPNSGIKRTCERMFYQEINNNTNNVVYTLSNASADMLEGHIINDYGYPLRLAVARKTARILLERATASGLGIGHINGQGHVVIFTSLFNTIFLDETEKAG
jgi:hypothetical protein